MESIANYEIESPNKNEIYISENNEESQDEAIIEMIKAKQGTCLIF